MYAITNRTYGPTTLDVRDYGAMGDGVTDDTQAIQDTINALPAKGGTVVIPRGDYLVDPTKSIKLRDRLSIQCAGRLMVKANDQPRYNVVLGENVSDITLTGLTIVGDRDAHTYAGTTTHEWGHGVCFRNVERATVVDLTVSDCTGDGMSIGGDKQSKDVVVARMVSTRNRRQALTIGRSVGVRVYDSELSYTQGTAPQAGVDIEPDALGAYDVILEGCNIHHNTGAGVSIYTLDAAATGVAPVVVDGVVIRGCDIAFNGNGLYTIRCANVDVFNNQIHDNQFSGVRLSAGTTRAHVAENTFYRNGAKSGAVDRTPWTQFGTTKTTDRDVLDTSTDVSNNKGRNYYR